MIQSEFYKIIKSKRSVILIFLIILIPIIDIFVNWYFSFRDFWAYPESYGGVLPSYILHPSKAAFLSGSSPGHIFQMLLVWILPLFILLVYSDLHVQEKKFGYYNILLNEVNRKKIVLSKLIVSFLVPFLASFIGLGLNFMLSNILFKGGTSFGGMETHLDEVTTIFRYSVERPFFTYCIYILLYCVISGCAGIICTSITFIIQDYKIVYALCFFIWIIQVAYPFSITYVFQPYIEYGLNRMIIGFGIFVAVTITTMGIGVRHKVKLDEL